MRNDTYWIKKREREITYPKSQRIHSKTNNDNKNNKKSDARKIEREREAVPLQSTYRTAQPTIYWKTTENRINTRQKFK